MPHMEFRRDDHIGSVKLLRKRDYHQGSRCRYTDVRAERIDHTTLWSSQQKESGSEDLKVMDLYFLAHISADHLGAQRELVVRREVLENRVALFPF